MCVRELSNIAALTDGTLNDRPPPKAVLVKIWNQAASKMMRKLSRFDPEKKRRAK
jgi:hypothetical protein